MEVVSPGYVEMIELDMDDADSDPDELVHLGSDSESNDPGQPCIQITDECLPIETHSVSLGVLSAMPSYTITRRKAELKSLKTMSRKKGVCRIRNMPLSVDKKRCLRREMRLDAEDPSTNTAFQCGCHQFALRVGRLRMHLSTLFSVKPWRGSLKQVGARFGTVVLSYFLFLRTLLLYNVVMSLLVGIFVALPQAILNPDQPQAQDPTFSGLELLTGEGYFTNSLLYYGYYTNSSLRVACFQSDCGQAVKLGYSIPLAYILIIIISFFVTCVMLVYSVSKSLGKSLLSEGGLTACVFCSWDFKVTKKSSILLKQANISTQLKELISDSVAQRRKRDGIVCQWLLCGLVWTICLGCTGICVLGIYLYINFLHLKKIENVLGLPFLVSTVNLLLPGLFRTVGSMEYYQSPSTRAYVAISRNLLLKTSILILLSFHWMTDSAIGFRSHQCWETYAGQELYRHMVADLIMTLLYTILGEFFWSQCVLGVKMREKRPAFDIARNVLDLIYGQTLAWAGVLFSPLLPAIQILKLLVLFYTKKASLLLNYRPSHQLWRTNQMNTILTTLLCFPAFTGAVVYVAYGIWMEKPDPICGPFRSLPTMFSLEKEWEELEEAHASLAWLSVVYTHLLRKPLYLNIISTFLMMVIYAYRQKNDGQKKLITLLKKQIRNEGEDKHFLISKLKEQEHQE
ncbi:transmembrane channel-like protein 6 [Alosa sapidissima]|uniref:transmembrane channel-like protein 6 n=1 Tax=Alosa sapidissima TaxID=34773 RepID=UPI001C0A142C|nr:transmembrane channel-like protein 6 [Alosa sapidissima]